jgi:hypothetical protein
MIASEIKRSEVCGERGLVFEAAQIENLRVVFNASDHRHREPPKRSRETFKCPTGAA